MLVRGFYFEGWDPSTTPAQERSREAFLSRVENALEDALWNEDRAFDFDTAARAALRVLSERISQGEFAQIRHMMPEDVRELWPDVAVSRSS